MLLTKKRHHETQNTQFDFACIFPLLYCGLVIQLSLAKRWTPDLRRLNPTLGNKT